jgi:hypothetical protein
MREQDATAELDVYIKQFGEAWARGDVTTLGTLLSPEYTHTDVFGKVQDRAAWLAYAAGRGSRRGSPLRTWLLGSSATSP